MIGAGQPVGAGDVRGGRGGRVGFAPVVAVACGTVARFPVVAIQQGIALDLPVHIVRQLEVRELQQLDRLLQLGRHDQGLGLPQVEALREGHSLSCSKG